MGTSRGLAIGLDGAAYHLFEPLVARGSLPLLQPLVDRGYSGALLPMVLRFSAPASDACRDIVFYVTPGYGLDGGGESSLLNGATRTSKQLTEMRGSC